ncbi:MAG: hypothetical protein AAB369_00885 [Chloroflexota bacterium]|mgnify:CR=1 FL=1
MKENARLVGTLISFGIALAAAGAFFAVTGAGGYTAVARYGGAAWVFLLALIVAMPTVLPLFKRRSGG